LLVKPHQVVKVTFPYCSGVVQEPARQVPTAGQAAAVRPGGGEVPPPQAGQVQVSAPRPPRRRLLLLPLRIAALRHPGVAL
jgi:hypothetical protein